MVTIVVERFSRRGVVCVELCGASSSNTASEAGRNRRMRRSQLQLPASLLASRSTPHCPKWTLPVSAHAHRPYHSLNGKPRTCCDGCRQLVAVSQTSH